MFWNSRFLVNLEINKREFLYRCN